MRILLFGASGMLGAAVLQIARVGGHDVIAPSRKECSIISREEVLNSFSCKPDLCINAAGSIWPGEDGYIANCLGPLHIAYAAKEYNSKFIHVSTDCVFSGRPSPWHTTDEVPDPVDMYGASKRYGELAVLSIYKEATVVRTSFVGNRHGLLQWFLSLPSDAVIDGYDQALWSGSSVAEVAKRILGDVFFYGDNGIQHLATELPMSKYEVLQEFKKNFRPDVAINRVQSPIIHRALKPSIVMQDIRSTLKDLLRIR